MTVSDQLFANSETYASSFASPFIPHKDNVRGFVYEVEKGTLREVL